MPAKSGRIILEDKVLCENHIKKYIEEWRELVIIKLKQIDCSHKVNKLGIDLCEDCGSLGFASITLIEREGIVKRKEPESLKVFLLRCDGCGAYFFSENDLKAHREVCGKRCVCSRHTGRTPVAEWTIKDFFLKLGIKLK